MYQMQNMMPGMQLNPMQQMAMNMAQNYLMPQQQNPQNWQPPQQPMQYMPQHYSPDGQHEHFAQKLEHYFREVAEGRREMPHVVKEFFSTAWHGAKHAVQERFEGRGDKGGRFWDKIEEACKVADPSARESMLRNHFPKASPVEMIVLSELANRSLMDERARRVNMTPENFRKHLKNLMDYEHE